MISGTRYRLTAEINRQTSLSSQIARLQSDISNKTRLQVASDDPAASARVAEIGRTQANEKQWSANIDAASALAARVDSTMTSVANSIDRAVELMTQASSDTLNETDRAAITTELRGIADDLTSYAAQKDSRGQPLFPDGDPISVPVGDGITIAATASKSKVFGVSVGGGTQDMITMIGNAADAVDLTDDTARKAAAADSLTAINAASDHISNVRGEQGVRAARLDSAGARLDTNATTLAAERSGLEDTDLTKSVAELQSKLLTLEAAQATFARLSQTSLFDRLN